MPQPCGAAAHACMRNGNLNGTLGALRPQTPDQGRNAPGPSLGETACKNIPDKRRLPRWGIRKLGASGPRKPGKSQGKSLLFPRDYSLAFPGCKTSGMAAKGGRARSATLASWAIPAKQQREASCLDSLSNIRKCGSREIISLVGCGAKPRWFLHRQIPIYASCAIPACGAAARGRFVRLAASAFSSESAAGSSIRESACCTVSTKTI